MDQVKLKYKLNEMPPFAELMFVGLTWFVVAVPLVLITGNIAAAIHYACPLDQVNYLQKIFFISGVSFLVQLFWGHRLPLIIGPSSILLVGVIASRSSSPAAVYTAAAVGGFFLFLSGVTGLFSYIQRLFTDTVVATVLILVAFSLIPMIGDLIIAPAKPELALPNLCFALAFVFCIFVANKHATGFWKSSLIMWSLVAGMIAHKLLFPQRLQPMEETGGVIFAAFFQNTIFSLDFDPGVILSFLVCFLALSINDLGAFYSVGSLVKPDHLPKRVSRGLSITGLLNLFSGLFGVIGPVNYSLSPGVIVSTGCSYSNALIPAGIVLIIISFLPPVIAAMGTIPTVVIGSIFLFIICSQLAVGLTMAFNSKNGFNFETGLVMGFPLMLGIVISFLPSNIISTFPVVLRPILGNGLVIGVITVLIMEHLLGTGRPDQLPGGNDRETPSP